MRAVVLLFVLGTVSAYESLNPMTPVVKLLRDLQSTISADDEEERKSYNRLACWCKNTAARLAEELGEQEANAAELKSQMNMAAAAAKSADQQAKNAKDKLDEAQRTISNYEENRAAENEQNRKDIAAASEAARSLNEAILLLSTGQEGTKAMLTQTQKSAIARVAQQQKVELNMDVLALLAGKPKTFLQTEYTPQSGRIMGTLKNMIDVQMHAVQDFWITEMEQQREHEKLMNTQNEIVRDQTDIFKKQTQIANEKDDQAATHRTEWSANNGAYNRNIATFDTTAQECEDKAEAQKARDEERRREKEAVKGAIEILDNPAARAQMEKSDTGAVFLQTDDHVASLMYKMFDAPEARAKKGGWGVEKVMDDMVDTLNADMKQDVEDRRTCIKDRQRENMRTQAAAHEMKRENNQIEGNNAVIAELEEKIQKANDEHKEADEALKAAQAIRNQEHSDFNTRQSEDEKAIKLLKDALKSLQAFYKRSLIQAPDGTFDVDKNRAPEHGHKGARTGKGNAVVDLIQQIVENTQADMAKDKDTEESNDSEFQAFKTSSENTMSELDNLASELNKAKSKEEGDKTENDGQLDNETTKKNAADQALSDMKDNCDFITNNFDLRRKARAAEIKGIQDAKATIQKATFFKGQDQ